MLLRLVGGIGLFLLGMVLLTDGLRSIAGDRLRRGLARSTGTPLRATATGAVATTMVQSSTATTLVTIGLVSTGALSLRGSLGIVFGANIGSTTTGWIVSLIGFQLDLGAASLVVVAAGALLRLLGRGRLASGGEALAGFGLLFVGIDALKEAMEGVAGDVDLARFMDGTVGDAALLVLGGIVMTILMQASGAALATTLAALAVGVIDLRSAALLVVGQNVGTTLTAIVAGLGATTPARRTALAHVLFNVATGVVALLALPLMLRLSEWGSGGRDTVSLALFHTLFNVAGVALFLPATVPLARLLERIVPEHGPRLASGLDPSLLSTGGTASEAATSALRETALEVVGCLRSRMDGGRLDNDTRRRLDAATDALRRTEDFLGRVRSGPGTDLDPSRFGSIARALDHLDSVVEVLGDRAPVSPKPRDRATAEYRERLEHALDAAEAWLRSPEGPAPLEDFEATRGMRHDIRERVLRDAATGPDLSDCLDLLDRLGLLHGASRNLAKTLKYLQRPLHGPPLS